MWWTRLLVLIMTTVPLSLAQDKSSLKLAPHSSYAMYNVVVENFVTKYNIQTLYIETETVLPLPCPGMNLLDNDLKRLCERLQQVNRISRRLEPRFQIKLEYSLIEHDRGVGPAGSDFGLSSYRPRLPNGAATIFLSVPAVSEDGRTALVYVGAANAADECVMLRKKNGKWTLDPKPVWWRPPS